METVLDLKTAGVDIDLNMVGGKAKSLAVIQAAGVKSPPAICFTTFATKNDMVTSQSIGSAHRYMLMSNPDLPPIFSVRSGAPISMPGMMETILNIGLNRSNLEEVAKVYHSTLTFTLDSYARLIEMYGYAVKGVEKKFFEEARSAVRVFWDNQTEESARKLVDVFEDIYEREVGESFEQDPQVQVREAVWAVIESWNSAPAIAYREIEGISEDLGTAVIIQYMVFGNLNDASATGVVFTHNPNTGEKLMFGDYKVNAQGEDVVNGSSDVESIDKEIFEHPWGKALYMAVTQLQKTHEYAGKVLDIEFTVQNGALYVLQCREAKISKRAEVSLELERFKSGKSSRSETTKNIIEITTVKSQAFKADVILPYLGKGLPACGSLVSGYVATNREQATKYIESGEPYIYVANKTEPCDVDIMEKAVGILTTTGGMVSHAVLVSRSWDKACVVGFISGTVSEDKLSVGARVVENGDFIRIDGETGKVYA